MKASRVVFSVSAVITLTLMARIERPDPAPPEDAPKPALTSHTGRAAPARAPTDTEVLDPGGVYLQHQVVVSVLDGVDLDAVAAEVGGAVLRPAGPSGYAALSIPASLDRDETIAQLQADPRIAHAGRNAVMRGARGGGGGGGKGKKEDPAPAADTGMAGDTGSLPPEIVRASPHQWHLDHASAPASDARDLSGIVVAVLDSGVAYADGGNGANAYVAAPSLAGSAVVAPWDFVDGDALAIDEHQHGTHIASLIASQGAVEGVAPGVSLMPVRVLDENNAGTEQGLLDGIYHAIDSGADIINMSLSFPAGYVPSLPLRTALSDAAEAGIVLVAAAGNEGRMTLTWPAASPAVIAVGASVPNSSGSDTQKTADYSNIGSMLDLMAPGGSLLDDSNGDGFIDGMLAETILPGDPSGTGLYWYAGTSQAAAVVSGAAAHLLAEGASPFEVRMALQASANDWSNMSFEKGYGAGELNINAAIDALHSGALPTEEQYYVSMMPLVIQKNGSMRPLVELEVLSGTAGDAVAGMTVLGTMWREDGPEVVSCSFSSRESRCDLKGGQTPMLDADGAAAALSYAISADIVIETLPDGSEVGHRVSGAMHATDALEVLLAAIALDASLDDAVLAFHWEEGTSLDRDDVVEAYTLLNAGTGLASSPLGVVFTSHYLPTPPTSVDVDLDGTGLASSPLGLARLRKSVIDGSGLISSPLGLASMTMLSVDGTGLASSPLGFSARSWSLGEGGADIAGLSFSGEAVMLDSGTSPTVSLGASLSAVLDDGGWVNDLGYPGATALTASGVVEVGLTADSSTLGSGDGAYGLPLPEGER